MKVKAYSNDVISKKPVKHVAADQYEAGSITCTYNGKDISNICVEADKPEGWADVVVMCDGRPLLDDEDEVVITRIHGVVELTYTQQRRRVKI